VDAGFPDKASLVFDAIRQLGRSTRDLRHLIFTHGHPDHIGSAAAIVRETGATTYMHALDALLAETGPFRPMPTRLAATRDLPTIAFCRPS
jgi:glyoxylase-like metal-dependent hydrolase (beta-lactamase superfamily II)